MYSSEFTCSKCFKIFKSVTVKKCYIKGYKLFLKYSLIETISPFNSLRRKYARCNKIFPFRNILFAYFNICTVLRDTAHYINSLLITEAKIYEEEKSNKGLLTGFIYLRIVVKTTPDSPNVEVYVDLRVGKTIIDRKFLNTFEYSILI